MLQKQLIDIAVNGDLNTKLDERLTNEGAFLALENVRFRTMGALKKRNGYIKRQDLPDVVDLVSDNSVLLARKKPNEDAFLRYDRTKAEFVSITDARSTESIPIELVTEISDTRSLINQDFDFIDNVFGVVFEADGAINRQVSWRFIDALSGEFLNINAGFLSGRNPKIKSFSSGGESYFFVVYKTGTGAVTFRIFDRDGIEIASQVITPATPYVTNSNLHLVSNLSGNGVTIFGTSTGGDFVAIEIDFTDVNLPVFNEILIQPTTKAEALTQFDVKVFSGEYVIAYIAAGSNTTRLISHDGSAIVVDSNTLASAGPDDFIRVVFLPTTGNVKAWSYRDESAPASDTLTLTESNSIGGTFVSIPFIGAKYPVSEPFFFNGKHIVPAVTNRGNFRTGFLLNDANSILAMYLNSTSLQVDNNYTQKPRTVNINGDQYIILNKTTNLETDSGEIVSRYGLVIFKLKLTNLSQDYITTKIGSTIVRSGGFLSEYDGASFYNNNFVQPFITNTQTFAGEGSVGIGNYLYKVIFEFIDKNGAVHRSEESAQVAVNVASANSRVQVTVDAPPDNKKNRVFNVVLYRTTNGGSVFYRCSSLRAAESQLGDSIIQNCNDGLSDAQLTTNEILYTTGGVLGNDPCPPCKFVVNHNNTLFVINSIEKDQINYSKRISNEQGLSFSDFFFFNVFSQQNNRNEKLTALASLREKLIIFKDASIHYVSGNGANDAGVNSTLTEPEMIYFDIGCTEPKSVTSTPMGVFFKSSKGIYLLDAGLGLNYIGAPVEKFNSEEIIASEVNETLNLVIFQTLNRWLVFDYEQNKWQVDTIEAEKGVIYQNKPVYLKSEAVFFEDSSFQDSLINGNRINFSMKMVTGWLKLGNLQGFARVYRVLILGEYKSAHTLKMRVYYDYDSVNFDEYDMTHDSLNPVYQFGAHLKRQKCQAIKIELFDVGSGESVQLSGMTFEVGLKRGTFKLPASKRV